MTAKRAHYLGAEQAPLHGNGINPHRWVCSDELDYCLRSIAKHAPDVRRIWIVTDGQIPSLSGLPAAFSSKISIVDHRDIFAGYESALPTFNSLSIETFLWRIPDLAEHFVYFNDDVFLTSRAEFTDFFTETGPVMRGEWVDFSHLPECEDSRVEAALLNHYNQIVSGNLAGFSADHMFESAHVIHPMQRSVMAKLFADYEEHFVRNSTFRFRSTAQFLPQSLHNHYCIKNGLGRIHEARDYVHISADASVQWTEDAIASFLSSIQRADIKFICINDLPQIERRFPKARRWIEAAIG
ncbi:stealth conserved region 3 domain-containing protein [Altererythrobacter sp. ZODW24]|uniref:stealth conserved region 3 domain-containing protein n=1 Tax=Altererythrobacter sp. ZODW24 TaxID=2185142 RepID=UPI001F07F6BB|nr:stealth conserved region 3 domain-containing protein [Altererythrobacter sp. ZODW24]